MRKTVMILCMECFQKILNCKQFWERLSASCLKVKSSEKGMYPILKKNTSLHRVTHHHNCFRQRPIGKGFNKYTVQLVQHKYELYIFYIIHNN